MKLFTLTVRIILYKTSNCVTGINSSFREIKLEKGTSGFHMRLLPEQLSNFTNIPLCALSEHPLSLESVFGKSFSSLTQLIEGTKCVNKKINSIKGHFRVLNENNRHSKKNHLLDILNQHDNIISVKQIQNITKYNERSLERYFKINVGLSPRDYLIIRRFNKAIALYIKSKNQSTNASYLDAAIEAGFYDQPHFIHHCKKLTSLTPEKFFNNFNPILSGTYNSQCISFNSFTKKSIK